MICPVSRSFLRQCLLVGLLWLGSSRVGLTQIRLGPPPPPPVQTPTPQPLPIPPPEDLLIPQAPIAPPEPTDIQPSLEESSEKITVQAFQFEGNTVFSQEELAAVVQSFTQRSLTFEELLQARSAITQFYVDRGYVTSGAYIPPQTLENGIVVIQIIEGSLEAINVTVDGKLNPNYVSDRLWLAGTTPLNIPRLLEALQLLQLNPIIDNISAQLAASTEPGQSILDVSVQAARSFYPSIILDNGRNPQVGSFRRGGTLEEINLSGNGDRLTGTYLNTDGSDEIDLGYSLPITPQNTTINLSFRNITSEIIEYPFSLLDLHSDYQKYTIGVRHPLWQTPYHEFVLGLAFSHQTSSTTLLGSPFPSRGTDIEGNIRLSTLSFSQEWLQRSETDVLALRSEFDLGINAFNTTVPFDAPYNLDTPNSNYFLWRGQGQWVHLLGPDFLFLTRFNLQVANSTLPSLEQFALGGLGSVVGYRQNTLLTDNGAFAAVELRVPLYRIPEEKAVLQLIPFVNWGTGWNHQTPDPDINTLASVGLGLQWQHGKNFSARIDWGKRLGKIPYIKGNSWQDDGIIFSVIFTP